MPDQPRDEASDTPSEQDSGGLHDDDELASALAAQLLRFAPSGPIPIVRPDAEAAAAASPGPTGLRPTGPRFGAAAPGGRATPSASGSADASLGQAEPAAGLPDEGTHPADSPEGDARDENGDARDANGDARDENGDAWDENGDAWDENGDAAAPAAPPAPAEPAPTALDIDAVLSGGSALERAERLQAVLSRVQLDDAAYREWEESLNALAPDHPRDAGAEATASAVAEASAEAVAPAEARVAEAAIDEPEADERSPRSTGALEIADRGTRAAGPPGPSMDDEEHAPPAVEQADEEDADRFVASAAPTTSSIPVDPMPASSIPDDEFVALSVSPELASIQGEEILEAEVVDVEHSGAEPSDATAAEEHDGGVPESELEAERNAEPDDVSVAAAPIFLPPMSRPRIPTPPAMAPGGGDEPAEVAPQTSAEFTPPELPETDPADGDEPDASPPIDQPDDSAADESPLHAMPSASAAAPITTGSIPVIQPIPGEQGVDTGSIPVSTGPLQLDLDVDDDRDVDDVVTPMQAIPATAPGQLPVAPPAPGQDTGPIEPVSIAHIAGGAPVLVDSADGTALLARDRDPLIETVGIEPTPLDRRLSGAAQQFWLWLAPNSSILTFALGAVLVGYGMSSAQAILAAVFGIALASLPLGLSTLAVKRTGQPTAVVSRAGFGILGNALPVALLLLVRLFWVAILLWVLAAATGSLVYESGYDLFIDPRVASVIAMVVFGVGAAVLAVLGNRLLVRIQDILAAVAGTAAIVVIALTWPLLDLEVVLSRPDGDWSAVVAGAMTVFALIGTGWAAAGGDLARYQQPGSSGGATVAFTGVGAALPALALTSWGVLLAASDGALAAGLQTDPIAALASSLPGWYPVPVLLAIVVSLVSGVAVITYSGGLTLLSLGARVSRPVATGAVAGAGLLAALGVLLALPSLEPILLDLAPTLAVPVAAWGGIVASDLLIRRRPLDSTSLLLRGGAYPDVRWTNLVGLVVITLIGLGLITGTDGWFGFEGYLWNAFGVDTTRGIGASDLGVLVALVLGLLLPLAGIRAVRAQEGGKP